jgi:hypothetical protein
LRGETVHDLRFFDGDYRMKMTISLTEFTLKMMTLSVHPMKRLASRDEELQEASEQS